MYIIFKSFEILHLKYTVRKYNYYNFHIYHNKNSRAMLIVTSFIWSAVRNLVIYYFEVMLIAKNECAELLSKVWSKSVTSTLRNEILEISMDGVFIVCL